MTPGSPVPSYPEVIYHLGPMRRLRADLLLLLAAAVWGTAFYFQKTAMEHVGPFVFIAARGLVAALCLAPLALLEARRVKPAWSAGLVRAGLAAGLAFSLGAGLQQTGLVTATVTNAGFLTGLYVVATPLIGWMIFRRRPALYAWPAVAFAFAGIWLLAGGTLGGFSTGDRLIAVSALVWALHMIVTSKATPHGRPVAFTAMQFAVVAVCGGAAALATEPITLEGFYGALPSIAYVGVLSSALTFTLLAIALKDTPPGEAAVLVSMETLFAAAAGAALLGERLSLAGWIGAGLMFAATLVVQLGPVLERQRRVRPVP
ncbi:MAG: DMT family transporter [Hyphomicrobiaceae bacterium]|nr:DMT family transporter [Hyphomicrobiaceae bacterium]